MRVFLLLLLAAHATTLPLPADDTDTWLLAEVRFHPELVKTIKHWFLYMTVLFNPSVIIVNYQHLSFFLV